MLGGLNEAQNEGGVEYLSPLLCYGNGKGTISSVSNKKATYQISSNLVQ